MVGNNVWFGWQCVVEYSISWDDDAPIPCGTHSTEDIKSETACGIVANNSWFVRLTVCGWILNSISVLWIDDTPTTTTTTKKRIKLIIG